MRNAIGMEHTVWYSKVKIFDLGCRRITCISSILKWRNDIEDLYGLRICACLQVSLFLVHLKEILI